MLSPPLELRVMIPALGVAVAEPVATFAKSSVELLSRSCVDGSTFISYLRSKKSENFDCVIAAPASANGRAATAAAIPTKARRDCEIFRIERLILPLLLRQTFHQAPGRATRP